MQDPPVVKLPGHPAGAGYLVEWRKTPSGWQALVEFILDVPGYRGRLEPDKRWFLAHEVEPLPNVDYSRVPRSYAAPPA